MGGEKGDAHARYLPGWAYYRGFGIKSDGEQSLYWLKKAADQGSTLAMDKPGSIYANGLLGQKWMARRAGCRLNKPGKDAG